MNVLLVEKAMLEEEDVTMLTEVTGVTEDTSVVDTTTELTLAEGGALPMAPTTEAVAVGALAVEEAGIPHAEAMTEFQSSTAAL